MKCVSPSASFYTPQAQISSSFLCTLTLLILLQLNTNIPHRITHTTSQILLYIQQSDGRFHGLLQLGTAYAIFSLLLNEFPYASEGLLAWLLNAQVLACVPQVLDDPFACKLLLDLLTHHFKYNQLQQPITKQQRHPRTIATTLRLASKGCILLCGSPNICRGDDKLIILLMSKEDSNLLDFLKKNSLFNNNSSPTKNAPKRSKSRSKDKNTNSKITPTKTMPYQDSYNNQQSLPSQHYFNTPLEPSKPFVPLQTNNLKVSPKLNDSRFGSFDDLEHGREGKFLGGMSEPKPTNQLWAGLVSHSTSFQSARIESSQCLQNLSLKVRNEISSINIKMENFNSRMYRVITDELKNLRERLLFIIDESFREGEKYIREYMKAQEEKLAGELTRTRDVLQKEHAKIEAMKEEISKPNWRKTAGEIIASHLESSVEELVKKSSQLSIGKWELGDLVGYRLKDLERDLRDAVRLKRDT